MALQKNDFIEIEFVAKTKEGELFDSNKKEELKQINSEVPPKPYILSLGHNMFLNAIDDFLIGKEKGKYTIELTSEKSFGKRDSQAVQKMPMKVFREHNLNPVPGVQFNFDGKIGKVLTSSGGRVIVDFNHPLAGKDVVYEVDVLRKVDDLNEKINAFNDFLFKKEFKFEVKDKKLIMEVEKQMSKFMEMFKDKFKEMFDLDLEVKEVEDKK
jgi:FKBP-type peptidyl-prolyl cis-trans isomerase SlyD